MGRSAGWMRELTVRAPMKSPGHPTHRRDMERLFWREITKGLSSEDAALAVGASQAAGSRWFRERGGMPTFMLHPISDRYLSFQECEEIALLRAPGFGRSLAGWDDLRRRSRGSCAATQLLTVGSLTITLWSRNGSQSWWPAARRSRSSSPTTRCANTRKSDSPARSAPDRTAGTETRDGALEGPEQASSPGPQAPCTLDAHPTARGWRNLRRQAPVAARWGSITANRSTQVLLAALDELPGREDRRHSIRELPQVRIARDDALRPGRLSERHEVVIAGVRRAPDGPYGGRGAPRSRWFA